MSFFHDMKMAAQDLSKNGLNLDALREEVGTELRLPLPAPPPRRALVSEPAAAVPPQSPAALEPRPVPVQRAEPPVRSARREEAVEEPAERPPSSSDAPTPPRREPRDLEGQKTDAGGGGTNATARPSESRGAPAEPAAAAAAAAESRGLARTVDAVASGHRELLKRSGDFLSGAKQRLEGAATGVQLGKRALSR